MRTHVEAIQIAFCAAWDRTFRPSTFQRARGVNGWRPRASEIAWAASSFGVLTAVPPDALVNELLVEKETSCSEHLQAPEVEVEAGLRIEKNGAGEDLALLRIRCSCSLYQQHFRLNQIRRIETFGEPAKHRR